MMLRGRSAGRLMYIKNWRQHDESRLASQVARQVRQLQSARQGQNRTVDPLTVISWARCTVAFVLVQAFDEGPAMLANPRAAGSARLRVHHGSLDWQRGSLRRGGREIPMQSGTVGRCRRNQLGWPWCRRHCRASLLRAGSTLPSRASLIRAGSTLGRLERRCSGLRLLFAPQLVQRFDDG